MKVNKWISLILVIVVLVSVVTACGTPEGPQAGDLLMEPGIYETD